MMSVVDQKKEIHTPMGDSGGGDSSSSSSSKSKGNRAMMNSLSTSIQSSADMSSSNSYPHSCKPSVMTPPMSPFVTSATSTSTTRRRTRSSATTTSSSDGGDGGHGEGGPGSGSRSSSLDVSAGGSLEAAEVLLQEEDVRPTILRVRVINQQSQRSKDLLVEISPHDSDDDSVTEQRRQQQQEYECDNHDDGGNGGSGVNVEGIKKATATPSSSLTKPTTVYDAIYDHPAVKKAHVRKWSQDVVQKIKQQQQNKTSTTTVPACEIRCAVWDDDVNQPLHTFTIDEIKAMTTRQLYRLVPESDVIKFVLMFVEMKEEDDHQEEQKGCHGGREQQVEHDDEKDRRGGEDKQAHDGTGSGDNNNTNCSSNSGGCPTHLSSPQSFSPRDFLAHSTSGKFRCPFSGMIIDESLVRDINERVQEQRSFASRANTGTTASVPVASGAGSSSTSGSNGSPRCPFHHSNNANQRQGQPSSHRSLSGDLKSSTTQPQPSTHPVRPLWEDLSGHSVVSTTNNTYSTPRSTYTLDSSISMNNASSRGGLDNPDTGRKNDDELSNLAEPHRCDAEDWSIRSGSDYYSQQLTSMEMKSTMRIRISNVTTKRYKDVVVDIKSDLNIYDAVYDNPGVKNAHVRKWGSDVVKDVKAELAEIRCLVVLGGDAEDDGYVSRSFSVDDLKSISTLDLFELAPDSDPIKLVLQCVKKKSIVDRIQKRWTTDAVDNPNTFPHQKGNEHASAFKLASSRSDPSLFLSAKRPPRPNHMILAAKRNASFSSPTATYEPAVLNTAAVRERLAVNYEDGCFLKSLPNTDGDDKCDEGNQSEKGDGIVQANDAVDPERSLNENEPSIKKTDKPVMDFLSMKPDLRINRYNSESSAISTSVFLSKKTCNEFIDPFAAPHLSSIDFVEKGDTEVAANSETKYIDNIDVQEQDKVTSETETSQNGSSNSNEKQIQKFLRACRSKRTPEQISGDDLQKVIQQEPKDGAPNSAFPSKSPDRGDDSPMVPPRKSYSALAALVPSSSNRPEREWGQKNNTAFDAIKSPCASRINRFLDFSRNSGQQNQGDGSQSQRPPIAEIAVVRGTRNLAPPSAPSAALGISMSSDTINQVFPYNIVIDESFMILQVGNNLSLLIDGGGLIGRPVSDILTITGPIPTFGHWCWDVLEKMGDKTIFLESVVPNSTGKKAKIKGSMIELSKEPRQVMLVLFPNVKNLAELEQMNLSMADLPLHSCQREAVLLGEHSKAEVKLTNHLDHLHRDLINSMEKQIEDRTNELALANKELQEANARIAIQSARQLEHFACMSHEIRTPLNCIVGMSSLLLEESNDVEMDPMHADSIRMINTSGELLKAVVDDVLDYAKLESGSFEVDIKPTKLQYALDSVVHSISQKVEEKRVRLRTHYSPMLPEVIETDSRRLQQVLFNLLGNAGKFSKEDSVIDLTVSVVPTPNGEMIRFSVKDYGKGICKTDFDSIFMPFSQASKETQAIYGGTGLGLSITSKLVNRLGGNISVDSQLGQYAEFTVDLPMNGQAVDVEKVKKQMEGVTIVLVEPTKEYDYSFSSFRVPGESIVFGQDSVDLFDLNVVRCSDLEEVKCKLSSREFDRTQHVALLVHETSYNPKVFMQVHSILGNNNYTLMTHGPNYLVHRTKDRHFKSLTGIFTVTLLNAIAEFTGSNKSKSTPAKDTNEQGYGHQSEKRGATQCPSSSSSSSSSSPVKRVLNGGGLFASLGPTSLQHSSGESASFACSPGGLFASLNPSHQHQVIGATESIAKALAPASSSVPAMTMATTTATNDRSSAQNSAPTQPQPKIERLNLKVLYAEDNLINQKVLKRVLERTGIQDITIVDNGKKAVDSCLETKYDVIFLDMQMPVMDGMEACDMIIKRDPTAKIVFVTAHALDQFRERAEAVGATSFISKPFRVGDITEVLRKIGKLC